MLLYLGLRFTIFRNSYRQLIVFFIVQTLSSFLLFLSFIYSSSFFITSSIIIKLALFPFIFWFINVMYRFPRFIFWLRSTLHKVPIIYIIFLFYLPINTTLLWVSMTFSILFCGLIILTVRDLRMILIISSISNNVWFILSQYSSISLFLVFFLLYSISLFLVLQSLHLLTKINFNFFDSVYPLSFWLLFSSGLPPFPIFFIKIIIIQSLFLSNFFSVYFILLLLSTVFVVSSYVNVLFKYFIYGYNSISYIILKY